MSEDVRKRLEGLRDRTGADSLSEVVRRALAAYEFFWTEHERGSDLFVRGRDLKECKVTLL